MTASAVLRDAAACALLSIELVVEITPNEAVVDDLCIGASFKALKSEGYQPLYRAVHDLCVKHGIGGARAGAPVCPTSGFFSQLTRPSVLSGLELRYRLQP